MYKYLYLKSTIVLRYTPLVIDLPRVSSFKDGWVESTKLSFLFYKWTLSTNSELSKAILSHSC